MYLSHNENEILYIEDHTRFSVSEGKSTTRSIPRRSPSKY